MGSVALIALAALAGCTSGAAPSGASRPPQATPAALLASALSAMRSSGSVHSDCTITATAAGSVSDMTQSEDSARGTGRILITTSDGGHLTLLLVDETGYFEGDETGIADFFQLSTAVADKEAGKWISTPQGNAPGKDYPSAGFAGITFADVVGQLEETGRLGLTAPTAFAGNAVNGVRGGMASSLGTFPGATETVYIAASGRPLPIRVLANIPGHDETTCAFSRWGEPVDLTAPPKPVPLGSVIGGSTTS